VGVSPLRGPRDDDDIHRKVRSLATGSLEPLSHGDQRPNSVTR
jgi:hypothetical protein